MYARTLSLFAGAAGLLCGTAVASVPQCTNVTLAPIPGGAEISYDLDSDAAVTLELFDDGVALSPDALQTLKGDGWGFVRSGTGRKIVWKGCKDVPNRRYAKLKAVVTAWDPDIPPPYMVVDLRPGKGTVAYYASADKVPLGVTNRMYKTTHLVLAKVPAAGRTWTLGSMPGAESTPRREIQRSVALTEDYYLGIYPVTGGQWLQFKATNPSSSHFYGADKDVSPVETVKWADIHGGSKMTDAPSADSFLGLLRARTGMDFNLPRAAQWEVACRAGCGGDCNVPGASKDETAWMSGNWKNDPKYAAGLYTQNQTHEVGLLKPNAFGLYDMLGNVLEQGRDYLFDDEIAFIACFGPGARKDNYRDIVWIDPEINEASIVVDGKTYDKKCTGRWGGAFRESGKSVNPSRWAASGGNAEVDTGFRVWCSVRNAGRLNGGGD